MLKIFSVESHLPTAVRDRLVLLVQAVEEDLQTEAHKVDQATRVDSSFQQRPVESPMERALICRAARRCDATGIRVESLGNLGVEVRMAYGGVDRYFRFRRATVSGHGDLVVTSGSDSILTHRARLYENTLWTNGEAQTVAAAEQWVLAYVLHPQMRTFVQVTMGMVVSLEGTSPPFKLVLGYRELIPLNSVTPPTPPSFPMTEDDLDLGLDLDDASGEDAGGGAA